MKPDSFLRRRLAAFGYAFAGIRLLLTTQVHAWIHLAATVAVVVAGFALEVSRIEWGLLIMAIGTVWTAEGINTAIEFTVDLASPEHHKLAGQAKDVAAGAVLLAALAAAGIGAIVFLPKLVAL